MGDLVMCENGYHACRRDDVIWWFDAELWEIEARGDYLTRDGHESKVCCRSVRLVRRVEAWDERTQRLLACDYAEHVLPIFENARPNDDRVRNCVAVSRLYVDGQATDEELAAAYAAADAAAAAARDAARDARDAERAWQINRFWQRLEEEGTC